MTEGQRRAYLEALGFDVWIARPAAPEPGRLGIGGGRGSTLLVFRSAAEHGTELAADLARALGGDPVWSWLDPGADEETERLADIVSNRLITRVLLFGRDTGRCLFQAAPPATIGSAEVLELPGLDELANEALARRALWRLLRSGTAAGSVA